MPLVLDVQTFRRPTEGNERTTTLKKAQGKEEAEAEYKLIREMSVDNDQVLPDARTRHWMVA